MWTKPLLDKHPIGWFCDAVCYLMLAVMPRRDHKDTSERLRIPQNCWSPSNEARRHAQSKNRAPWVVDTVSAKRFGTLKTTIAERHVPISAGGELGNRKTLLEKLKGEVAQRELDSRVPRDIVDAFWVALNQAEADARVTDEYDWLPSFDFGLRGWRSKASQSHSGTAPASPAAEYNGPAPQQYTDGENAPRAPSPAGEVGNHRFRTDLWALVDDGRSGFDIYDVTDAVLQRRTTHDNTLNITSFLEKSYLGLKARPEFQQELKESHEPLGKLIRPLRREEIAERDGEFGRPFWIILGQDVFDITAFPFESTAQRIMLRSNPGGNPMHAIDEDDTVTPEQVFDDLWPYRKPVHKEGDCLIIFHGMVYDLTPVDARMVYGWKGIQETTQSLRGTDASEKVMADLVVDVPDALLDLISRRELIVAKTPPPLPEVTPEQLALNDGSVMEISEGMASSNLAQLPPVRRPVWVGHGWNVYDLTGKSFNRKLHKKFYLQDTALWEYGEDNLREPIESYKGQTIPTGPFSRRLEQEFSHRVVGVLVQSKRPAKRVAGDDQGGQGESESPSKRRAM
ncbi:putative cytochrome b5-like heme steroid binding domain-containing protein [Diaporthe ampelina]|uniref:Putative cytochrome b5-like heme steroid binding domain-containing protein n=1 Tax=Diaporthe ampelina TaxID=1214573 RepID=A0A0G2HUE6_9PEZI|nr:putative cytochrome b5-like heme steroid binding domain-containing protein [Diaporthe ampelina]